MAKKNDKPNNNEEINMPEQDKSEVMTEELTQEQPEENEFEVIGLGDPEKDLDLTEEK